MPWKLNEIHRVWMQCVHNTAWAARLNWLTFPYYCIRFELVLMDIIVNCRPHCARMCINTETNFSRFELFSPTDCFSVLSRLRVWVELSSIDRRITTTQRITTANFHWTFDLKCSCPTRYSMIDIRQLIFK